MHSHVQNHFTLYVTKVWSPTLNVELNVGDIWFLKGDIPTYSDSETLCWLLVLIQLPLNRIHCQTAPTKHLLEMPRSGSLVIALCDIVKLGSMSACGWQWWSSCKALLTLTILEFAPFSILLFIYLWEPAVTWTANQSGFSWEACRSTY